jgi:hypothetical protein
VIDRNHEIVVHGFTASVCSGSSRR